ncbi:hypothetical protein [Salicibibacter halophilus]|nr:hypothetical protein [Salicibibacter halophilus]
MCARKSSDRQVKEQPEPYGNKYQLQGTFSDDHSLSSPKLTCIGVV